MNAFDSQAARALPASRPACARAAFLVSPAGESLAAESASDNVYMDLSRVFSSDRARAQHQGLQRALSTELPVISFAGDPAAPDGMFPNNVFGTRAGTLIIGQMRHRVRQLEAERSDIRGFFTDVLGYATVDLRGGEVGELTGSLVIDRARGIGYAGLGERCTSAAAQAMAQAFDLRMLQQAALAPGEYHTNVVMAVLAGRVAVLCADGWADPKVADAIAAVYAPQVLWLEPEQKAAFAANCISLRDDSVWMSATAADVLSPTQRTQLQTGGLRIRSVELDEIEKAGGSLRCCVGEIF
ncbi:arginine deiminase-related protein [Aquimonas sp.]|uniref:arginine deiminase-related protein n=1 Tax=Aquimonas sp. TaxID=1872588 RepID=UPI0037BFB4A5